jgi:N4-gp56 family major capsid protein
MTTYGDISQRTAAWAAVEMLEHAKHVTVLTKFGMQKPMPKNKADNALFRRPITFAPALVPLQEGVTPDAQVMRYEDVPAALEELGAVVLITNKVNDLSEDPVLKDACMLCGEQIAETIEAKTWGILQGGTSVFFATTGTTPVRDEVDAPIDIKKLHKAVRYLRAQRARRVTQMLSGSPNFATQPIEAGYIAFGHTDLEHDIRNLPGFTPVAAYGSRQPTCSEELGSVENVRFILSPMFDPWEDAGSATLNGMKSTAGDKVDVYSLVIIGQDAFGLVSIKGQGAIVPSVVSVDTKTKDDPLGQRGYVGWRTWFTAFRAYEPWLARIECGASDL